MERTLQGAEGDTGADCKTKVHYQEEENREKRKTQRNVCMEERGKPKRNGYQRQEWKNISLVH